MRVTMSHKIRGKSDVALFEGMTHGKEEKRKAELRMVFPDDSLGMEKG